MNIKTINKNQKPIEHDIHLKYICQQCGIPHWLSFKEAQTKNFKIVCDCGDVFTVKRVKAFKIKYYDDAVAKSPSIQKPVVLPQTPISTPLSNTISPNLLEQTVKALLSYGFTSDEAADLVTKSYNANPNNDIVSLVKQTLESLRNKNVN